MALLSAAQARWEGPASAFGFPAQAAQLLWQRGSQARVASGEEPRSPAVDGSQRSHRDGANQLARARTTATVEVLQLDFMTRHEPVTTRSAVPAATPWPGLPVEQRLAPQRLKLGPAATFDSQRVNHCPLESPS